MLGDAAGLGALLSHRLDDELAERLGAAAARVDTDRLLQGDSVAPALREGTDAALAASLHTVFVVSLPIALVALALAVALPIRPLRSSTS